MPGRVGQYRPPVAARLEPGLARTQRQAPLNRLRDVVHLQVQVVTLRSARARPARRLVAIDPAEPDAGPPGLDYRVPGLAVNDFPAQYLVVELGQHRRVGALQVHPDQGRESRHRALLPVRSRPDHPRARI